MNKYLSLYLLIQLVVGEDVSKDYVLQQNIFVGNLSQLSDIPASVKFIEINNYSGISDDPKKFLLHKKLREKSGANKLPNEIKLNGDDSNKAASVEQTTPAAINERRPRNLFELLVHEAGLIDDKGKKKERTTYSNLIINRSKLFKIAEILRSKDDKEPTYIYKTNNDKKVKNSNHTKPSKNKPK